MKESIRYECQREDSDFYLFSVARERMLIPGYKA